MACSKDFFQGDDIVGGYDLKLVTEDKDISCSICLLLLREAMGTPCSHLFCKSCLQRLTKQVDVRNAQFPCPFCQEIVNEVVPNAFVNRLVTGSDVYCQQNKPGCPWKGSLASYFEKHDRECGYKIVNCQNEGCVFSCERRNLQEHVLDCKFRIVECEHCNVELKVIELDKHYSSCAKFPAVCPHDECGSIVPKNQIEEHLNTRCEFVIVNCQYATFGCMEKVTRRDMEKHNQSLTNNHMNLMFKQVVLSKNEIDDLRQEKIKSRNEIDKLREENTLLRNEIDKRKAETENQLDEQRKEIEKQKNEIEKQKNEVEEQKNEIEKQKHEIEKQRKEFKELKEQLCNKSDKETSNCEEIEKQKSEVRELDTQLQDNKYEKVTAHCSKNPPSASSYKIDELLSKGTEKWIRKKDIHCFDLNYKNWYSKIFDLMKENQFYQLGDVIYVKVKHSENCKQLYWNSNKEKKAKKMTCKNGGLKVVANKMDLFIYTGTFDDFNHKNSSPFILHPRKQERMITMKKGRDDEEWNGWVFHVIPNHFFINKFLIVCLVNT